MKKILMTTNGMQIGGAETHILELATELKRMGYDITIASNGGVYVHELEVNGISHVKVPLNSKNIFKMIKSYYMIKKLIKTQKFDVVHAHARIPAFLCGLIQKKYDFRFITTAHWVFDVTGILRFLTNWGERTIAVSQDIKQYLVDNYEEDPNKITITINGIDTQKFSPDTDTYILEKELDLDSTCKKIVYVSRMDTDRSAVAFMLVDIIDRLDEKAQLIIVGGGNDLPQLRQKAERINHTLNRTAVIVTGARVDINKCVALADIFVGVSRAALEAMSSAKPVIIAGNEGYIGIFSQDTYNIALSTNFCCRGCPSSSQELLQRDINSLLKADLGAVGEYNRQMIIDNYSVRRMAFDCVEAYNMLLSTPRKGIIISGYYGYKNIGDDAVLAVMLSNLRALCPRAPITVLSKTPAETEKTHNVKCVQRFNIPGIIKCMRKSSLLISGGGSLFQDITSTHSLMYYISIIKMARKKGLKVMIYANGIGPLRSEKNKKRAKSAIELADIVSLRDMDSFNELKALNVDVSNATVTADPAFALVGTGVQRLHKMYEKEDLVFGGRYFAVSVREWSYNCQGFEDSLAEVCKYVQEQYGLQPVFTPMQQSKDLEISVRIAKLVGDGAVVISDNYTVEELLSFMGSMEFVVGMRLHTLIYAISRKVPVVGLSYDPKIDSILHYAGVNYIEDVTCLDVERLKNNVDSIMENKEQIVKDLDAVVTDFKNKTMQDAQAAINLYMNKD